MRPATLINAIVALAVAAMLASAAFAVMRELAHGPTDAQAAQDVADDVQDAMAAALLAARRGK